MAVPSCVPSLDRLIDTDLEWTPQCHWSSQTGRKGKTRQRCGNKVSKSDVETRKTLIDKLHGLLPLAVPEVNRSDRDSEIQNLLKKLSELLLCERRHRNNSSAIYTKWSGEQQRVLEQTVLPVLKDVREELGIEKCKTFSCLGKTAEGKKCANRIGSKLLRRVDAMMEVITSAQDSSPTTLEDIKVVAQLLMCKRFHQDQAPRKAKEWISKIKKLFPIAERTPAAPPTARQQPAARGPSTPPRAASTGGRVTPESTNSTIWSRASSDSASTPATSPPSSRRSSHPTSPSESPVPQQPEPSTRHTSDVEPPRVAHNRVTRRTVSLREQGYLPAEPLVSYFVPLKKNKKFLKNLYYRIRQWLSPEELRDGYIYGFQREGEMYIKIGTTSGEVEARIKKWEAKCHQKVVRLFDEPVPYASRLEKLIHLCLHRERRRETCCNNGDGCAKSHIEWFDVTLEQAKRILNLWKRWVDTKPYNRYGYLKENWIEHIDQLWKDGLYSSLDSWEYWIDTAILEVEPDPEDQRPTVSSMNRTYTERIHDISVQTSRASLEIRAAPQGPSLHMDDPFVTHPTTISAVAA